MKLIKNLEWTDYFSNRINNEISSHNDQNTIVLSFLGAHYIHDVLFFGMKTNSIFYNIGQGGHILLENSRFQLNTEATAGSGGNIFSQGIENFVQSKVCCTNCSSNSNGMHSSVSTGDSQNQKSIAELCSFAQLTGSNGKGILFNILGYCNFNQINISISDNQMYSCIRIGHIRSESTISSSNFKNNTSSNGVAIDFYNEFPDNQIKQNLLHCNIIEQSCYGNKDGIISARQCLIIDSCVIKDNNAPDSFLFYAAMSISVSNSYINNPLINSYADNPAHITITNSKSNEDDIKNYFKIATNCKERKYLQINLAEYETFVNNKGISIFFYLTNAYLTTLHAPS